MANESEFVETLLTHRVSIIQNIQVDRTFIFDYLLSKSVFDRDDYDLVRAERTREQRAAKFLDIMETKGENGFKHFKDALQLINPNLYEKLTGEKATIRSSPIVESMEGWLGGESHFIDQDILSSHLKRVTDDLRDITLRYNHLLKDNKELRKGFNKSNREREAAEERAQKLNNLLENAQAVVCETQSSASLSLIHQYETMQKDRDDTKDFIIQLQMKLLQSQEEADKWTRENEECRVKCDDLAEQLSQVHQNYALQRNETRKLSDRLKNQTVELSSYDNLKLKCRQKQFQVAEVKCALDEKEKELDELKNWTEALKHRYDATAKERDQHFLRQRETEDGLSHLQSKLGEVEIRSNRMTRENEELQRERAKIEQEACIFRKQSEAHRESYLKAVEQIDEVKGYFTELLAMKEKELKNKTEYAEYFEKELEDAKTEVSATKKEMSAALAQNDELMCKLNKLRFDNEALKDGKCSVEEDDDKAEEDNTGASESQSTPRKDDNNKEQAVPDGETNQWKKRSTGDLLDSIRRRFVKSPTSTTAHQNRRLWRRSLSFDTWLETLVPAYNELSPAAKKSFSLEGYCANKHVKQTLSYETLSYMLNSGGSRDGAENGSPPSSQSSHVSPAVMKFHYRERMKYPRKMSSPLPLNLSEIQQQALRGKFDFRDHPEEQEEFDETDSSQEGDKGDVDLSFPDLVKSLKDKQHKKSQQATLNSSQEKQAQKSLQDTDDFRPRSRVIQGYDKGNEASRWKVHREYDSS